jgi:hypothetical protein
MCVLLGVGPDDDEATAEKMAAKLRALRIFEDADGKMNEALGGALRGTARRANRLGGLLAQGILTRMACTLKGTASRAALALAGALAALACAGGVSQAAVGDITEYSAGITAGAAVYEIAAGPDGNMWFTERNGNRIGKITPAGVVTEYSAGITAGAQPFGIAAGPDGNMWFTENAGDRIGKITPAGVVTEYSAGITAGAVPNGIAAGPDGNMWFTELIGNRIGKINPATGQVTEYSAGITAGAGPFGIAAGPDGNMWFTEFSGGRIGKIIVGLDLSVTRAGTGSGTVTSSVAGIDCGSSCSAQFDGGTSVTLTATPSPGSTFGGWSGACSGSGESCTVVMNQAREVTASFAATPTPTPPPAATVSVASVKQKVSRKGAYLTSRVTVSGAGKISQRATTGSKRLTTRCRVSKTTTSASTHTLKCNLGSKGRRALKKGALKLTLRTTFTPTTAAAVTSERKLTIKRRR